MGLLDKLWDDTLAGPRPETGLGRLRKHPSFSSQSNPAKGVISRTLSDDFREDLPRVTRSIMIKRPAGCPSRGSFTPPASPAGSTPPLSPFSGGKEWNPYRRKFSSERVGGGGGKLGKSPSSSYEV